MRSDSEHGINKMQVL